MVEPTRRMIWWSNEAKDYWEGKFRQAENLFHELELLSVKEGERKVCTRHFQPDQLPYKRGELIDQGLHFLPLQRVGNYSGFAHCVTKDTMVNTGDDFKKINNLETGDSLEEGTVKNVFQEGESKILKLDINKLENIEVTPEHKIRVVQIHQGQERNEIGNKQWKRAGDINTYEKHESYDAVIVPKKEPKREKQIFDLSSYALNSNSPLPSELVLDKDLAWFLGWFMAEGYAHTWEAEKKNGVMQKKSTIELSLGPSEGDIAKQLKKIIREKFNIRAYIKENNADSGDYTVQASSNILARFLIDILGDNSENKYIPSSFFNSPRTVVQKFIDAYIEGDGWKVRNTHGVSSASKRLIKQLQLLLLQLGRTSSYTENKRRGGFDGSDGKMHQLILTPIDPQKKYYREDDDNFYFPIRSIEDAGRKEVLDLHTSTGTFQIPFIVHNSHPKPEPGKWDYYGVVGKSLEDCREFQVASQNGNHDKIGELLGFPENAREFFQEYFADKNHPDPIFDIEREDEKIVRPKYWNNIALRYFGFRLISFFPSKWNSDEAVEFGKTFERLAEEKLDKQVAIDTMRSVLKMPYIWSSLHGVVQVWTPLFQGIANTGYSSDEKRLIFLPQDMDIPEKGKIPRDLRQYI